MVYMSGANTVQLPQTQSAIFGPQQVPCLVSLFRNAMDLIVIVLSASTVIESFGTYLSSFEER